jgi:hypothetical protein
VPWLLHGEESYSFLESHHESKYQKESVTYLLMQQVVRQRL